MSNIRRYSSILLVFLLAAVLVPPGYAARAASGPLALPDAALLADPVFARPGFESLAAGYLTRTRYLLALDVDFGSGTLAGHARVLFVNTTDQPLKNVIFRLYPNIPRFSVSDGVFKRRMVVDGVTVNDAPAPYKVRDAWQSVLDVPLAATVPVGGTATIDITYRVANIQSAGYLDILEPYPIMAIYDVGGWREDVDPEDKGLDWVYSESALHVVRVRVAGDLALWPVGVIKKVENDPSGKIYTVVTGPVREFSATITTKEWKTTQILGGPVPVTVIGLGNPALTVRLGQTATDALKFYDASFGAYPYAQFVVVARNFPSGGKEYPTMIFVNNGNERDDGFRRFIAAHETAHQWFYGLAGDDAFRHAWLAESLAQVAGYLFYKNVYGAGRADSEYWSHILTWSTQVKGKPHLIDTPLAEFKSFNEYMSTTYGLGAVFFRDLSASMGEVAFIAGLKDYVSHVNLGIGDPVQLFTSLQANTNIDLAPLFCKTVGIQCPAIG